ncbi:MAG: glucose-1-phosphate cytidylyltransferase [wastewater metagenome]|nr:glucose-1-phosphate cytidylyltransferase [Candidatus Loosdrechtia aerotolerans]
MKVIILAGGMGTRLAEETEIKPKPMVEIGGYPIIWHIMMHYSYYGFTHFVIALGYKGEIIKKYILDYCSFNSNLTVNLDNGDTKIHGTNRPDWTIDLVDTGISTLTGGRIKRLAPYIGNETFMLTYGDGVSNVNLHKLLEFHRSHGKYVTLTAVRPVAHLDYLDLDGNCVLRFSENFRSNDAWINGGFFVLEPEVFNYIGSNDTPWEKKPLESLEKEGQLKAYRHTSFWQCMDTLRDKQLLENLWQEGNAPWKIWK